MIGIKELDSEVHAVAIVSDRDSLNHTSSVTLPIYLFGLSRL